MTLEANQDGLTRLYFKADQTCIGGYDEVAAYEQETGTSCDGGSGFFKLPEGYDPIGKSSKTITDQIGTIHANNFRAKKNLPLRPVED